MKRGGPKHKAFVTAALFLALMPVTAARSASPPSFARARIYATGPASLAVALVDVNGEGIAGLQPKPLPDFIYFAVSDIESFHQRARELNCLSSEDVHGASAGEVVKRPWGERSFYAHDPWGNGLCFVDENTLFTGR